MICETMNISSGGNSGTGFPVSEQTGDPVDTFPEIKGFYPAFMVLAFSPPVQVIPFRIPAGAQSS